MGKNPWKRTDKGTEVQKSILRQEAKQFGVTQCQVENEGNETAVLDCVGEAALPQLSSRSQEQFCRL